MTSNNIRSESKFRIIATFSNLFPTSTGRSDVDDDGSVRDKREGFVDLVTMLKLFTAVSYDCGQYYKLFTVVITPLAVHFSVILTELADSDVITAVKSFITLTTGANVIKLFTAGSYNCS